MKKGISLVALVITIIVLIILTAAVILTGGDAPEQAQKAVFFNDVSSVQDAVTLKMLNNIAAMADPGEVNKPASKWDGVVGAAGATELPAATGRINPTDAGNVTTDTFNVYAITATPTALNLSISATELAKYAVDENGVVYYYGTAGAGKTFDSVQYYSTTVTGVVGE